MYSCKNCNQIFKSEKKLEAHNKNCLRRRSNNNQMLGNLTNKPPVKLHMVRQEQKIYPCDMCSEMFSKHYYLLDHKKHVHNCEEVVCKICGKSFKNSHSLQSHISLRHKERPVNCDLCNLKFSNLVKFNAHKSQVHENVKCEACGKTMSKKYYETKHKKLHEGVYAKKCECGKIYYDLASYNAHYTAIHQGVRYLCDKCPKSYVSKYDLQQHQKTHEPDYVQKMFKCKTCEKEFASYPTLRRHKRAAHGNLPICAVCGKIVKTNMANHMRTHTKEKPYHCNTCGRNFAAWGTLKDHERTHTNERPHKCEHCGKGFTQRTAMRVHMRLHTGEKPYKCNICDMRFITKTVLMTHMKTH